MKYGCDFTISLSVIALEKLCSIQKWYDLGDSEDVTNLLNKVLKDKISIDDIIDIAIDIVAHTAKMNFEDVLYVCDLILQKALFSINIADYNAMWKITNEVIKHNVTMLKKVNQKLRDDKS